MTILLQKDSSAISPLYTLVESENFTSGGTSTDGVDVGYVQTSDVSGAASWKKHSLSLGPSVSAINLTPDTLDISELPLVVRVAGTTGEILVTTESGVSKRLLIDFEFQNSGTSKIPRGFVSGSPSEHCWDVVEQKLVSTDTGLFSSVNHSQMSYMLNSACWANGWDFSGVSVWNSVSEGFGQPVVVITRRHAWGPWHTRLNIGDTVRFRAPDGSIEQKTIVGRTPGNNLSNVVQFHENKSIVDLCVYTFDSDIDSSIRVYEIGGEWVTQIQSVPENDIGRNEEDHFQSWSDSVAYISGGLIRLNRNREVSICPTAGTSEYSVFTAMERSFAGQVFPIWAWFYYMFPFLPAHLTPEFDDWFIQIESGDSGSPVFAPTSESDLVLVTVLTATTGGMMPNEDVLNKLILISDSVAGISTGYTVTVAPDPTA